MIKLNKDIYSSVIQRARSDCKDTDLSFGEDDSYFYVEGREEKEFANYALSLL